ncbi:LamG-like jellyroll fold domain-containing protein [Flavobacterium sp. LB2R40]|uniref:LamG-like jellyroll fold domain-containing protein n=1 Tax=unclassified Flavobacterium TaxID=196869 RepID=UPI003AB0097C
MKKNKYTIIFATVLVSQFFVSCNQDSIDTVNSPIAYEPIGGFESSDAIAAGNLVTKLSFDNNLTDSKNNLTGFMGTNVGYATGIKGNAYSGSSSQERYAVANATQAITSLNNFTVSFWMNTANTVDPATPGVGKGAQGIFSIVRPLEFWGGLNLYLENPDNNFPNRLRLKLGIENGRAGVAWKGQGAIMNLDNSLNQWIHVVFTYNAATSIISAYVNGALCANLGGFPYAPATGTAGVAPLFADNPGDINNINNAPKYGNFQMTGTNGKVVIGTHQFETTPSLNNGSQEGWATSFAGLLDEFRIYNVALSINEISALNKLEKDNR